MANKNFKGRKKGAVNTTIIKDPKMEPFFITKDQYGFVVNESNPPQKPKPLGYYSNFDFAIKAIAQEKLNEKRKTYESLDEYVNEWRQITEEFTSKFKM